MPELTRNSLLVLFALLCGLYLLLCRNNRFTKALNKTFTHFSSEALSAFLGSGILAIGLSAIPMLIGSAIQEYWLLYLGGGLMLIAFIVLFIVEECCRRRNRHK